MIERRRLALLTVLAIAACAPSPSKEAPPQSPAIDLAEAPKISPAPEPKRKDAAPKPPVPTTRTLRLGSAPVDVKPSDLNGLRFLSAVRISSGHPQFGGLSGLEIAGTAFTAVTDKGWLLRGTLDGGQALPSRITLQPLLGQDGKRLRRKSAGDAEALAWQGSTLWIAFERDHRLMALQSGGRLGNRVQPRIFERLRTNSGIEALAALPGNRLLAIAEQKARGDSPIFVISASGAVQEGTLPRTSRHSVTGADMGPDGLLYLVLRHYSPLWGVSGRLVRMGLLPSGLPDPASAEDLATFASDSGIDNMEGISVWQDAEGRTRLTLISDDNFSVLQRTLLVDFLVE